MSQIFALNKDEEGVQGIFATCEEMILFVGIEIEVQNIEEMSIFDGEFDFTFSEIVNFH